MTGMFSCAHRALRRLVGGPTPLAAMPPKSPTSFGYASSPATAAKFKKTATLRQVRAAPASTRGVERGDARDREVNRLLEPAEDASEDASGTTDGGHAGVASNGYQPLDTIEERTPRKRSSSTWEKVQNAVLGRAQVYAVQGGAIHSFDRLARKEWVGPKKRTLNRSEMNDAVSRLNGEIARDYFLKHGVLRKSIMWVQQSVDVVYIWLEPDTDTGTLNIIRAAGESSDDAVAAGGLVVTEVKPPWAWKVRKPAKLGDPVRRVVVRPALGEHVVENQAGESLALPASKKCLGDMVTDMGRNLKTILEILWQARQIEFSPVQEAAEKDLDQVAWLTSDCDLSSPRVRRLDAGEKFNVLDLREVHVSEGVNPLLRIRTRDGWVTWGSENDVNKKTGLSIHWRLATAYARSDTTLDPPLFYAGEDKMKEMLPPECRNLASNIEDPWISIPAIWKKQRGAREGDKTAEAKVTNWSQRPLAQRERIAQMAGGTTQESIDWKTANKGIDWKTANKEQGDEFDSVVAEASSALAQVHFFKSVPTKYLEVLAAETAIGIERYKKGETVVKFDGGQSFACAMLLRDAERPMHHLRAAIQIDVPETVSREKLNEWVKEATRMREQRPAEWKLPGVFVEPVDPPQGSMSPNMAEEREKFVTVGDAVRASLDTLKKYLGESVDFYLCDLFAENTASGACKLFSTLLVRMRWADQSNGAADKRLDIKKMRGKLKQWTPVNQWFATDILAEGSTASRWDRVREWKQRLITDKTSKVKDTDEAADEVLGMVNFFLEKILGNKNPDRAAVDALTDEQIDWLLYFKDEDQLSNFVREHPTTEQVRTPAALQTALRQELRGPRAWLKALDLQLSDDQIDMAVSYAQEEGTYSDLKEMDEEDFDDMVEEMELGEKEEKFKEAVAAIGSDTAAAGDEPQPEPEAEQADPKAAVKTPVEFHLSYVQPLCIADADASSYGHKRLQKKLYIVHKGSCNVHKSTGADKYHRHRAQHDVLHLVGKGGFFGEMQLLHECDLHGYATAREDLEVWTVDEDKFTTFRGMTMKLLRTVAKRFYRCQQLSDESTAHLIPQNGKPFYLDQDQAKPCKALVDLNDVDNRSYVPIHLLATDCPFGVEELRVFLEEGVQLRSLIMSNPWEGEDTTSMVAENMKIGKLDDLSVLQLGAGPSDRGICELVHTALSRRLIRKDGAAAMTLFNILTVPVASERQHERSSVARRNLLELITAETPMTGERKIELHKFVDYPVDLALCFGKFAMKLADEQPNEGYEEMVTMFEQMACSILDECNTEDEVELILRQSSEHRREHCRRLLQGSRDLMEYSLQLPAMQQFVSNRNYAAYAEDLWCKHQVTEVEGLKESAHTRRWRADVEDLMRPMVASVTSSEIFLKFVVVSAVTCIATITTDIGHTIAANSHAFFFVFAGALVVAAIPGSERWAVWIGCLPLWFVILQIGRLWLFCFPHQACANGFCDLLKHMFVQVHAAWRVPVVVCGTWLFFHMLAILTTTYVVVEDTNKMSQSFLLVEHVMYTQALGIICSECFQLYQTMHELDFRDAGRNLEGVPYYKFGWVQKMVDPDGTIDKIFAVVMWCTCPVWWPLLRVSFGTANGLWDLQRWCRTRKSRPRHFQARLLIKFPCAEEQKFREAMNSKENLSSKKNELDKSISTPPPNGDCQSFNGVCDTLEQFLNDHRREKGTVTKISDIRDPVKMQPRHFCDCLGSGQSGNASEKNGNDDTLMSVLVEFELSILPNIHHVGSHKIDKSDPDEKKLHLDMPSSQAALDSLVHSEKQLLAVAEPQNLPQLNARQDCKSYQVVEVRIVHSLSRTVALVCDALDGLYQHCVRVMASHCLDVWQCIDSCVVLVWILNFASRLMMLSYTKELCFKPSCLEESEANALFVWSRMWAASLAVIIVFMWLRALHFFMLDSSLGPMVLMVIGIIVKDVVLFGQLFVVFLLAFGTAFVSIYRFDPDMFATFPAALGFSFESAFGQADFSGDTLNSGSYYAVARVMFWSWFILVNVVLLNILIAMMTSTYEQIKANVRSEWRVQRTRFIYEVASSIKNVGNVPPLVLVTLAVEIVVWVGNLGKQCLLCGSNTPDDQYEDTSDDKEENREELGRADSASLLHFMEDYDAPVRMWGIQPHIRNKHTIAYENTAELEKWVQDLDDEFAGSGAAEFPTFYDHAEARTPQLALHQRWRDLVYTRARFDDDKKDPTVRRDIKKIDDTTDKIEKDGSLAARVSAIEDKMDQMLKLLKASSQTVV